MKKFIPIAFLSALVLVGAGCGSKNTNSQSASQPAAQNETSISDSGTLVSGDAFGDFIKQRKSVKCVLLKPGPYTASSIIYIGHGKMRSDGTAAGPDGVAIKGPGGLPIVTHSIIDGTTIYSWEDTHKDQATKTTIEDLQKLAGSTSTSTSTNAQDNTDKREYTCTNWRADNSLLSPPSDITFRDFKEVMCAPCEKITDAKYKEQCKKITGC